MGAAAGCMIEALLLDGPSAIAGGRSRVSAGSGEPVAAARACAHASAGGKRSNTPSDASSKKLSAAGA
jgi:hypothetical protein